MCLLPSSVRPTQCYVTRSERRAEATLSSPQSSLVVFNDTLLLAPTYVVLTDKKEDEYESLGIDTAQVCCPHSVESDHV